MRSSLQGEGFLLWGLCVLAAIWVQTVFVAYPSAVMFLVACSVCVVGGKST